MNTSFCLSRSEIAELARSPRKKTQVGFLIANGIRHYLDAYGWPVVTRVAVEGERAPLQPKRWEPNKALKD